MKIKNEIIKNEIIESINDPLKNFDDIILSIKNFLYTKIKNNFSAVEKDLIAYLEDEKSKLLKDPASQLKYARILSWLRDEKVLLLNQKKKYSIKEILSTTRDNIENLFFVCKGSGQTHNMQIYFDIDAKNFGVAQSNNIFIIVQCMFIVIYKYKNGNIQNSKDQLDFVYTLHDRSYSGAEDAKSQYALVTGRISVDDLKNNVEAMKILKNALVRELQEIDEVNLDSITASDYVEKRAIYIGSYTEKKENLLGFLFAIPITPEEYEKINKNDNYLIPIESKEYSKLRMLNLLGGILTYNSCNNCYSDCLFDNKCDKCEYNSPVGNNKIPYNCKKELNQCILKDIYKKLNKESINTEFLKETRSYSVNKTFLTPSEVDFAAAHYQQIIKSPALAEKKFVKNNIKISSNSTIIAVDISNYTQLKIEDRLAIRDQIQRYIYSYFPIPNIDLSSDYTCNIQTTGDGYLIILETCSNEKVNLALIGFFFAFYLQTEIFKYNEFLTKKYNSSIKTNDDGNDEEMNRYQNLLLKIALHCDDLEKKTSFTKDTYYPGDGLINASRLLDFCNKGQTLASQNFVCQIIGEFEKFLERRESIGTKFEIISTLCKKSNIINLTRFKLFVKENETSEDKNKHTVYKYQAKVIEIEYFKELLEYLKLPPNIIINLNNQLDPVPTIPLSFRDFGFFTDKHGIRHKVFSLELINNINKINVNPLMHVSLLLKDKKNIKEIFNSYIKSFQNARDLAIYGYSNIRVLLKLYNEIINPNSYFFKGLETIKIIFHSFDHIKNINEKKSIFLARLHWMLGLFIANFVMVKLSRDIKNRQIIINHTDYGFYVTKLSFCRKCNIDNAKDYLRFHLPFPGEKLDYDPIFNIYKGSPLYHEYLEIVDKYIERGIKENCNVASNEELNSSSKVILEGSIYTLASDFFEFLDAKLTNDFMKKREEHNDLINQKEENTDADNGKKTIFNEVEEVKKQFEPLVRKIIDHVKAYSYNNHLNKDKVDIFKLISDYDNKFIEELSDTFLNIDENHEDIKKAKINCLYYLLKMIVEKTLDEADNLSFGNDRKFDNLESTNTYKNEFIKQFLGSYDYGRDYNC